MELTLSGVLVNMGSDRFLVDDVFGDAVLIDAHSCDRAQRARIDLHTPIGNHTNDDLPPNKNQ
jgi:hypothetical protein